MPFVKEIFRLETPQNAISFLKNELKITQREAQRFIDKGRVEQNGVVFKNKAGILQGEVQVSHFKPQDLGIKPIFKTADFAMFDKPHRLLSHPKGRFYHLSLLDAIRFSCGDFANPINRLDSETSGILLVSRHKKSEVVLKNLFESRAVKKCYLAEVCGRINLEKLAENPSVSIKDSLNFTITAPIKEGKIGGDLGIRSFICKEGRFAQTAIKIISFSDFTSLLEVYPLTGRTHQIRVHLAMIGHRIMGECLYGVDDSIARDFLDGKIDNEKRAEIAGASRLMLHSQSLRFRYENTDFFITSKMDFIAQ